ncbi:MAG: tRNA 4-thiouridine(8) synthase ThiI [Deltaproteobacteria bacterium]|nr:tRNA 4-thiouridine(8) synthase ThiI [Deltaproteobacteria bacterium]
MSDQKKNANALGLCSGGLDSRLAAAVLKAQGLDVTLISFETPFFSADKAEQAAKMLDLPLIVKNITPTYIKMLQNPPCGYGKYMNPCMDCHALMFRIAGDLMKKDGYDFLFSGEVLGQRPMSQTRPSLRYVEKQSGYAGYILRPLSAKCLPETTPEMMGLVDRNALLDITGRSRKRQMDLAEKYGITDYPAPAGGCLLTDKGFSTRLKDLFANQEPVTERTLNLLKYGRHFRLPAGSRVIVGRTRKDNKYLGKYFDSESDTLIRLCRQPGPLVLVTGDVDVSVIRFAAGLCVGYSKAANMTPNDVRVSGRYGKETIQVLGISPGDVQKLLL